MADPYARRRMRFAAIADLSIPTLIDPEPIDASVHRVPTVTRQALARDEHLAAARRHLIAAGAGSAWVEDVIVEAARRAK